MSLWEQHNGFENHLSKPHKSNSGLVQGFHVSKQPSKRLSLLLNVKSCNTQMEHELTFTLLNGSVSPWISLRFLFILKSQKEIRNFRWEKKVVCPHGYAELQMGNKVTRRVKSQKADRKNPPLIVYTILLSILATPEYTSSTQTLNCGETKKHHSWQFKLTFLLVYCQILNSSFQAKLSTVAGGSSSLDDR